MKRLATALWLFLSVGGSYAADPVALSRDGVLWRLSASPSGAMLVGTKDGEEVARSLVPFPLGVIGQKDVNLQLLADETSGKVVLAWERQWGEEFSAVMLAVWREGEWEQIVSLSGDPSLAARNPKLKLATATSTYPDPENPENLITVSDSFALVLWWQGRDLQQEPKLAVLDLGVPPAEENALRIIDVPTTLGVGINCDQVLPAETLEHPLFAAEAPGAVSHMLVASPSTCLVFIHELRLELEPAQDASASQEGIGAIALRRRHTPIFGVRRMLPVPREFADDSTRVVLGTNLQPVLYRVRQDGVEYTVATAEGWAPKRTLQLTEELTLDKALGLVQGLAR